MDEKQLRESMEQSQEIRPAEDWMQTWDVSGKVLNFEFVRVARKETIQYFHKMGVYTKVPTEECWNKTKKQPIGVRWVDVNKQDDINPK